VLVMDAETPVVASRVTASKLSRDLIFADRLQIVPHRRKGRNIPFLYEPGTAYRSMFACQRPEIAPFGQCWEIDPEYTGEPTGRVGNWGAYGTMIMCPCMVKRRHNEPGNVGPREIKEAVSCRRKLAFWKGETPKMVRVQQMRGKHLCRPPAGRNPRSACWTWKLDARKEDAKSRLPPPSITRREKDGTTFGATMSHWKHSIDRWLWGSFPKEIVGTPIAGTGSLGVRGKMSRFGRQRVTHVILSTTSQ
jgi:hypothetical protein